MHEVRINNRMVQIPSSWDELTRHQLELVAGLSCTGNPEMTIKIYLLFYIAGIHLKKTLSQANPANRREQLYQATLKDGSTAYLSSDQVTELANLFNFLFLIHLVEDGTRTVKIDSRLTVNLIPYFKVSGTCYYGPADKLFNVTLSEFIHAETNLSRYNRTRDIKHLDTLIAILYRPQKNPLQRSSNNYDGDRRVTFNDHKFDKRAIKFRKLRHNIKIGIFLFYQGCQWWYQQKFPHVFNQKSKKAGNDLGFLNLVDALTAGDVTKTKAVYSTSLMEVMVHLERAAIDYEEMELKLNKK